MPSIATSYLGLTVPSPIVVSSSSLTSTINGIRRAADAGAGAIVVKSLFEEQIDAELARDRDAIDMGAHPEAADYIQSMSKHLGTDAYLSLLSEAKAAVGIPVIASVNCITPDWWTAYGRQIATTGADGLELNIAFMPRSGQSPAEIEERYVQIVSQVSSEVELPIAVKIGPYFTCLPEFADRLSRAGATAIVLFNRFYQFDIDIKVRSITSGYQLSAPEESANALRWISILSQNDSYELAGSTGIYTGEDAIKFILAGASSIYLCSTLYKNGYGRITEVNDKLDSWLAEQGFASVDDARGLVARDQSDAPERFERLQYIKALTGVG